MFVDSVTVQQSAPADVASVEWTASLLIPKTGTYGFDVVSPDSVKLYIDNKLLLELTASNEVRKKDTRVTLSAGKHDFRVEYALGVESRRPEAVPGHLLKVGWRAPTGVYEPKIQAAVALAAQADVAVVVVRDLGSETLDRAGLTLPNDQDRLIEAVSQANPRTIVALTTGAPS